MNTFFKLKYSRSGPALIVFCFALFCFACKKELASVPVTPPSIVSFTLLKDSTTAVKVINTVVNKDSIVITVPGTTNLVGLTTKIILPDNVSVSPASGVYEDFSQPVTYASTAADGSVKTYVVKVVLDKLRNIVYLGNGNGTFYALDADDGSIIWTQITKGNFEYSSPILNNGIIYAGNTDGNMYAFDAALGNIIWRYKAGSSIESSSAISGNTIYFGSDDHHFYAVDATTGNLKWQFVAGSNVGSSPLVNNNIVYFGSDDGSFYALDATTGSFQWKYTTGQMFNKASPAMLNGVIFIGDRSGLFYALDASNGQLKWQFSTGGISLEMSTPVIVNNKIYLSSWYNIYNFSLPGSVYELDATTGNQVLKALPDLGFSSGPVVADGEIFISADNGVFYALDAVTANIIWVNQIYPNGALPAVKDGVVYVGGGGTGYIYAFNEKTGNLKWTHSSGSITVSKPYIIGADGN